jgi:hypothetical protein
VTAELLVLCAAAAGALSFGTSALIGIAGAALARRAPRLPARSEARLALAIAAAPAAVAAIAITVALLPSFGVGIDHCLAHDPHHPHLCLHHVPPMPGWALLLVGLALIARMVGAIGQAAHGAWVSRSTARRLAEAAPAAGGVHVLPTAEAKAFVLGIVRPRLFASAGLLSLGPEVSDAVLAHERAHLTRRDPLRRFAAGLLLAFHLPGIATRIRRRLLLAQEMAADADAAAEVGDPGRVAAALLSLARSRVQPAVGVAFAGGDVERRVLALLDPVDTDPLPAHSIKVLLVAVALVAALLAGPLHHGLETLLGLLG